MSRCIRAKLQSLTSCEWNNKTDDESGRYLKESPGNEIVVVRVWVCDTDREEHYVGRRAMGMDVQGRRKRGISKRRWLGENKVKRLSEDEVYVRAIRRSSNIDLT